MTREREIHEANPDVGDRIEVFFSDGHVHARGVLVAKTENPFRDPTCFLHMDAIGTLNEWPATFRKDQVRRERSMGNHLARIVQRLTTPGEPKRRRFFWERRDVKAEGLSEVDVESARAVAHYLDKIQPPANVADQIFTETTDGLKRGDRVRIYIADRNETGVGTFVAEYKGLRHVIFESGGSTAYPKGDVTAE
jgi:hypothetical protein